MNNRCFVIMPFSGKKKTSRNQTFWTNFYNDYIKKTVEELGYKCERSDASSTNIVHTIVADLFGSDIVLAVLTDFSPNVFYELGVRHSLAYGTIMAIQKNQKIPFDLSNYWVIYYERNNRINFQKELKKIITSIKLKTKANPDNPVGDFLNSSDVAIARISANISASPLDTIGSLGMAQSDLLIVGQNLFNLANDSMKKQVFSTLLNKPKLSIRILYADSRNKTQVRALSQIIDEEMSNQFISIDLKFRGWLIKWENKNPSECNRLQIRRCKRVGNVSATLVDSDNPDGTILIRPVLYHTQPNARPCHWLKRHNSHKVYDSYKSSFEQIWSHGKPLA